MAIDYHINSEDGLISMRADAGLTLAELHCCGERMMADRAFEPSLPHLIDLREADLPALCANEQALARTFVQRYNNSVRGSVAVLIDGISTGETLADVYRLTCSLEQAELFDSYEHALRWLVHKAFAPQAGQPAPPGAIRPSGQQPDPAA
ncbi:MAG: hypothetical protein AB8B93_11380 [Pseudomonadales bacterium]